MTSGQRVAEGGTPREQRTWPFYTEPLSLDVRGLATAYRRQGSGEPVVYLHGAGLTRRWLPLYEILAGSVDLVVPEHPGFGDTPRPAWLGGFDDLVLHYDELLDLLGLDRVHLVGHSLGGWIAAEFAVFYPRRVRSLTLIAPLGLRVEGHPVRDLFRMRDDEAAEVLFNGNVEPYGEYLEEGDPIEAQVHAYEEMTSLGRLMWNPRYDIALDHRLDRVRGPALVVTPDEDRLIPGEHFTRWVELLPNARLAKVSGSPGAPTGHLLIVQQPDELAAAIVGFIEEVRD